MKELEKAYNPKAVEAPTYERWERSGFFTPENLPNAKRRKPFVISMPPPNVTGDLHLGHATGLTIEDVLTRSKRMQGFRALWVPGTDHAGIATQVLVERLLRESGVDRNTIGRDAFLKHVWQWKEKYGDHITRQTRSLGCSCDWTREHFTMDSGLTRAVQTAFIQLYKEGLIYRGERIISWCPRDRTALSDLEVKYVEQRGKLYVIRYPLMGSTKYVTVATTRPETMLGDSAVAVHPADRRYREFIGKTVTIPLIERQIPIIADRLVDPDFGTGAVKVTPAHDKLDHAIGQRHGLPTHTVIDEHGKMTKGAGEFYGLSSQAARGEIVKRLEDAGQLERVEDHVHSVATCDRCGHVIEPRVSLQWFVSTKPLAKPAIAAVRSGKIRIVPKRFEKVYFHWLEHIEDWCISRQLWWGHRIPIWYCTREATHGCKPIASVEKPRRCPHCGSKAFRPEEDTLDTWFSSGLWTFSTLGWPKLTKDLKAYHPTDVMETGWDLLFFWVARMVMMSLHFLKKVPFRTVYLHGLVLDREGRKMSKSKGTGIDPIPMTEKYGTDAIRLSLVVGTSAGQDTRMSEQKISHERNFINKLWNVGRFVLSQRSALSTQHSAPTLFDRWIRSRLNAVAKDVTTKLAAFRFGDAAMTLEDFLWHELADWYVEAQKVRPNPDALREVFSGYLKLLHPFAPYVTEELWRHLNPSAGLLMIQSWPKAGRRDPAAERQFDLVQQIVKQYLLAQKEAEERQTALDPARVFPEKSRRDLFLAERDVIEAFANVRQRSASATSTEREAANLAAYIAKLEAKLNAAGFRERAPKAVVAAEEAKLVEAREQLAAVRKNV